ncbi:MAG: hypothetical protein WAM66_03670 [Acidobacteriaceae bacterium]
MKMKFILPTLVMLASIAITPNLFAQAPGAYRPGQTISFKVTFAGPDADKLTNAHLYFRLVTPIHNDQQAFGTQLGLDQSKQISSGQFEVSVKVSETMASGTFKLFQANAGPNHIGFVYQDGLPDLSVTIKNPAHFIKPELKGITETSEP